MVDPVKGADVPDEVTETRDEDDNTSISEVDLRDQFRNDIPYPISPFGSPQVDVVTDPLDFPNFSSLNQTQQIRRTYDQCTTQGLSDTISRRPRSHHRHRRGQQRVLNQLQRRGKHHP
jgi:hypothetical protein